MRLVISSALVILLGASRPGWAQYCSLESVSPAGGMLPNAFHGRPYQTSICAEAYNFYVEWTVAGQPPPGLTWEERYGDCPNNGGSFHLLISGVPTQRGRYVFNVTADAQWCTGSPLSYDYLIRVLPAGAPDLVVALGAGQPNPSRVRIKAATGRTVVELTPYSANAWGAEAAAGPIQASLLDGILTGPGPGPGLGPHVRAFDRTGAALPKISFFAYGALRHGVHPALADLDAEPIHEVLTGPGPGASFGPHVRGFDIDQGTPAVIPTLNYFAYSTLAHGVNVTGGDIASVGTHNPVTAPGPGPTFGPTIRGWSHAGGVSMMPGCNFDAFSTARYGARVSVGDVDDDGLHDLLCGRGPGPGEPANIRGFEVDGGMTALLAGCEVTFPGNHGALPGGGDVDLDGWPDIVAGQGPDPAANTRVRMWGYNGVWTWPKGPFILGFLGYNYGGSVAVGYCDYP